MARHLSGIYAIVNDSLTTPEHLLAAVEGALAGGARLLQYRNKAATTQPADRRVAIGYELLEICQQYQVPLLINDDLEFCAEIGAQGVHLGQRDGDCRSARAKLGPDAIIGITCHDSLTLAQTAAADGADYVAFGRFFPSVTKPEATPAALDILTGARTQLDIPLVAIGGINADNGGSLIEAGADMLAVIHGLFGELDQPNARELQAVLNEVEHAHELRKDDRLGRRVITPQYLFHDIYMCG